MHPQCEYNQKIFEMSGSPLGILCTEPIHLPREESHSRFVLLQGEFAGTGSRTNQSA